MCVTWQKFVRSEVSLAVPSKALGCACCPVSSYVVVHQTLTDEFGRASIMEFS